jgi:hypothetical protein
MESTTSPTARLAVEVMYKGVTERLGFSARDRARALFERACNEFGIPAAERERLALYLGDCNTEVNVDPSVEQAGVKPDTTLTLRAREGR